MVAEASLYTYRAGKKVQIRKRPDQFVTRALSETLSEAGLPQGEVVSSASTRITTSTGDLEGLMARARGVAPTHHAYEFDETRREFLITDRILVRFKTMPHIDELGEFAGKYGLFLLRRMDARLFLFQVTTATGENPVKTVVRIAENEASVENVDHDLNIRAHRTVPLRPTDPEYEREWHLHRLSKAADYDPRSSVNVEEAWALLGHYGLPGIVVGLTDDGCLLEHPDFDSTGKFASWAYFEGTTLRAFGSPGASPSRMHERGADHGTACAGVIGAEADGQMTVGAAPGCTLLPVKWESRGASLLISDSKLLDALNFLSDKVDVVSNSWGSTPANSYGGDVQDLIRKLASTGGRRRKGIVFLWAAGNENSPLIYDGPLSVPYSSGWTRRAGSWEWAGVARSKVFQHDLAAMPEVLMVGALASTAQRSHYSNYGTGLGLCAPSNNLHLYGRLLIPGRSIITTSGAGGIDPKFGGTSSATPLAAGIAALVISANPSLTAAEVVEIMKTTASRDLDFSPWPRTPKANYDPNPSWDISPVAPYDTPNFSVTSDQPSPWSPWFGCGRVDAEAAVRRAIQLREPPRLSYQKRSLTPPHVPSSRRVSIRAAGANVEEPEAELRDVTVSLDPGEMIQDIRIDGRRLALSSGEGQASVPPGQHLLSWAIRGYMGQVVTLAISAPDEAKWSREITLQSDGQWQGTKLFTVYAS